MAIVIDTNVILVANRQHQDVSAECVAACTLRLDQIMRSGRVALDDRYRILGEYQKRTTPQVGKRPGDVFLKWLLRNNVNSARCDQIALVEHADRGFESFPDDDRLAGFDPSDRKFVAVAAAHPGRPPIVQATDSKWVAWAPALQSHGIATEFVCPNDIQEFAHNKDAPKARKR